MSARGARSRKVQAKETEKKEKKVGKTKAPIETIYEPHDGFADWRTTPSDNPRNGISRSITVSSRGTSRSSGTNDSASRPRMKTFHSTDSHPPQSSGGGSASISDVSSKGRDKTKYQANGKETKAPRGRGGGVPIKRTVAPSPAPPAFRAESAASYPSNNKTWLNFKVWEGGKHGMRPYGGFALDEDMHQGSVLIYFTEEQADEDSPLPSIRADLSILENSGSTWLSNALLYGRIDDNDNEWMLPSSPESSNSRPGFSPQDTQAGHRRMLGPTSPGGMSPPPFDIDQAYDGISTRAASRLDHLSDRSGRPYSPPPIRRTSERNPTHEIHFPAPERCQTPQAQRLYHVAIRNFLAMLHGKPIVGADLYDMLSTLQREIEIMYDLDNSQSRISSRERSIRMITNYLGQHGIDDVRSSIKSAMCLLAWSEQDNVKWRQGYLETFVHLAGVMIPELEEVPEFKRLSIVTRRNLGIAAKTLKLRVMEAEEKLANFDFNDLWEDASKVANSPVYQSYQAFRQFLVNHYTRNYGNWPPASNKTWLNRKIALALQDDFGSLYDYLVNRDVLWNPREERASRKWEMAHRKNDDFKADLPELGMTDFLVKFDAKFSYAHIPHPYPLLPRDVPKTTKEKEKKSFFSGLKKDKSRDVTKDAKAHLQLSILFSDATNIEKLDVNFNGSTLIDKFEQFEMTTDLKNTTPREARLGRWVLLYGILQVLSTLSVDVQGLKHTDAVRYFLCTDLKRCPEWVTNGQIEYLEASQQRSWCWQRSWDPAPTQTAPVELEATQSHEAPDSSPSSNDTRTQAASRQDRRTETEAEDLDGATLLQSDIHRINEKINALSLRPHAHQTFTQEFQTRRENEKSLQSDWKPRYDSLPQPPHPTPASLARTPIMPQAHPSPNFTLNNHHLPHKDFDFNMHTSHLANTHPVPPPRSPLRETVGSMNTDLAGYPFSPEGMGLQWPVPPGYSEANQGLHVAREAAERTNRESGIGYSTGSWAGVEERERGYLMREGERRERSGWS
ncbi:hypothetical protein BKA63DRAFT_531626 [Paraphoma chrysanthemicola]|nr:hypothetical protein BKA63DRAFT_531626 [Paraphoma chrysanthemicola]